MKSWQLSEIETPSGSRSPAVLHSNDAARAVLIGLEPGQELGDHGVKEHAFLIVVDGAVRVDAGDESLDASAGAMLYFEPDERHAVSSPDGARLLLMLAPWPGEGHFRGQEQQAAARLPEP